MNNRTNVLKIRPEIERTRNQCVMDWARIGKNGEQYSPEKARRLARQLDDIIRLAYDAGVHDGINEG